MQITEDIPEVPDTSRALRTLELGDVFYFSNTGFKRAIEKSFIYMVVSGAKYNTINIVRMASGITTRIEGCDRVNKLNANLVVSL